MHASWLQDVAMLKCNLVLSWGTQVILEMIRISLHSVERLPHPDILGHYPEGINIVIFIYETR